MKRTYWLTLLCASVVGTTFGQDSFKQCSAAFLGNRMIVNEYTPAGTCVVSSTATGELTVNTVELSPNQTKALDKIPFRVAIRDNTTHTLLMYSNQEVKQVDVQKVLAKCKKGDHIVLLTLDDQYALPHNEITVQ
ncbi:hypothetical protein [Spirosoma knui]